MTDELRELRQHVERLDAVAVKDRLMRWMTN
jgi:hypothetical protein